jgi:hypothetical protein
MKFIHMKSFIYGHIHPCKWINITLHFKFQTQSSKFEFYIHAQTIFKWSQGFGLEELDA